MNVIINSYELVMRLCFWLIFKLFWFDKFIFILLAYLLYLIKKLFESCEHSASSLSSDPSSLPRHDITILCAFYLLLLIRIIISMFRSISAIIKHEIWIYLKNDNKFNYILKRNCWHQTSEITPFVCIWLTWLLLCTSPHFVVKMLWLVDW